LHFFISIHQCNSIAVALKNCTKEFTQSQGLARHIRNEKTMEENKEEHLRFHSGLIVCPRGCTARRDRIPLENPSENSVNVQQLQVHICIF
jgi:hypothetical protein